MWDSADFPPGLFLDGRRLYVSDYEERGGVDSAEETYMFDPTPPTEFSVVIEIDSLAALPAMGSVVEAEFDQRRRYQLIGIDEVTFGSLGVKLSGNYRLRLRLLDDAKDVRDKEQLLYETVFGAILDRVRNRVVSDVLVDKGLVTEDEFERRFFDVVEHRFVEYATEIVSREDAEMMRETVLRWRSDQHAAVEEETTVSP